MSDGGGGGGTVSYCCFMQTEDPLNGNKDEQKLLTGFIFLTQICCCSSFSRSLHQAMKGGGGLKQSLFLDWGRGQLPFTHSEQNRFSVWAALH